MTMKLDEKALVAARSAAREIWHSHDLHPLDSEKIITAYLAALPVSGEHAELVRLRKFLSDAQLWLDSRVENAKPGWMVAQLPGLADALEALSRGQAGGTFSHDGWFELRGDARLGPCATEGCGGQPAWRLEAYGVGSDYCSGCAAAIRALPTHQPDGGEQK